MAPAQRSLSLAEPKSIIETTTELKRLSNTTSDLAGQYFLKIIKKESCFFWRWIMQLFPNKNLPNQSSSVIVFTTRSQWAVASNCGLTLTALVIKLCWNAILVTLHYTAGRCIPLPFTALHCKAWHYITQRYTARHFIVPQCTPLHTTSLDYSTLPCSRLPYTALLHPPAQCVPEQGFSTVS